jgi:hypothetical protein
MNFKMIDIEEICQHEILQKFLANALGSPKKEEEELLLRLRLQVTNTNLVRGDFKTIM